MQLVSSACFPNTNEKTEELDLFDSKSQEDGDVTRVVNGYAGRKPIEYADIDEYMERFSRLKDGQDVETRRTEISEMQDK